MGGWLGLDEKYDLGFVLQNAWGGFEIIQLLSCAIVRALLMIFFMQHLHSSSMKLVDEVAQRGGCMATRGKLCHICLKCRIDFLVGSVTHILNFFFFFYGH